jgi:hypothetical protein
VIFYPSNPVAMISISDGGIKKTTNCLAASVAYTSLDPGYITSQFYTLAIDQTPGATNDIVMGGLQDNGTWFTNNTTLNSPWTWPEGGDGAFCAIAHNRTRYYTSRQEGKVVALDLDANGNRLAFRRIDPIGGSRYQFINPFVLDPNNTNRMYLPAGRDLWRNDSLSSFVLNGTWDSTLQGWKRIVTNIEPNDTNRKITAIAACKVPSGRVYVGVTSRNIYRIDNADQGNTATTVQLANATMPIVGYVSSICVDPHNGDHLTVVYSNYKILSIFTSWDAGQTWTSCGGNLEEFPNGSGNGPSCRWMSMLYVNGTHTRSPKVSMNPNPSVVISIVVKMAGSHASASKTYRPWKAHTSAMATVT